MIHGEEDTSTLNLRQTGNLQTLPFESPFISWSRKPASQPTNQPTNQPTYLPTNHPSNHRNDLPTATGTTTTTSNPPHHRRGQASMIHSRFWRPAPDLACGWLVFNEYNAGADHIEYENGKSTSASPSLPSLRPPLYLCFPLLQPPSRSLPCLEPSLSLANFESSLSLSRARPTSSHRTCRNGRIFMDRGGWVCRNRVKEAEPGEQAGTREKIIWNPTVAGVALDDIKLAA